MKTLYIECKMGAAGDMLMSALFELLNQDQKEAFLYTMNHLFPDDIRVENNKISKCGIGATQLEVIVEKQIENSNLAQDHHSIPHNYDVPHNHGGYSYNYVLQMINRLDLSDKVKENALEIYRIIGEAESRVHCQPLEQIHFHEVGTLDALADVIGNCILLDMLDFEQILVSPINVGNGTVKCAHGILPVPAPATALILKGIPYYTSDINSELCTPTGAAVLKYFAKAFTDMPSMVTEKIGIGAGHKDFPQANVVRVFGGCTLPTTGEPNTDSSLSSSNDRVVEICSNLDDITGEELGFAMDILLDNGALDVFFSNIYMKKNRPAIMLTLICKPEDKDKFISLIFKHTTTRGLRYSVRDRNILASSTQSYTTSIGDVRVKTSTGLGISKSKYEYDDLRKLALNNNMSIEEVISTLNNEIKPAN